MLASTVKVTRAAVLVAIGLFALACKAEEEWAPLLPPTYVPEHPVCTARASAYYADAGCLGPEQFFGEETAQGTRCPVADASVCVAFPADAGSPLGHHTWVFSGEHYGIPDGRRLLPCNPETRAAAIAAPSCTE